MNISNSVIVLKIGGEIFEKPDTLKRLCQSIAQLQAKKNRVVIVHGGGMQVNQMLAQLGQLPNMVDGRRITDASTLEVLKMVIAGRMNTDLVSLLQSHGTFAVGLTGVDARLLNVVRRPIKTIDYGYVGNIQSVNPELLNLLIQKNYIPVIAPLGSDEKGVIYNINADTVASAIALSLQAKQWIILSNIDGIYDQHKKTLSLLTCAQVRQLIKDGVITDGMIPKVEAILAAIEAGLPEVRIMNGFAPEKFSQLSSGTLITHDS